jgi:hypothetical protein
VRPQASARRPLSLTVAAMHSWMIGWQIVLYDAQLSFQRAGLQPEGQLPRAM